MSENGHINGNAPQNLEKLFKALPGLKREVRKRALKANRSTIYGPNGKRLELAERPRAICIICARASDFAKVVIRTWKPRSNVCNQCAEKLQDGFTAFVAIAGHCICRHPSIANLAGKIVPIPDDYYRKLKVKFDSSIKKTEPPKDSASAS